MANPEWNGGICPVQPSLPNLLLLSLERVGVRDPPEFVYREYEWFIGSTSEGLQWDSFHPPEEEDARGLIA
jgi:hypothetical protein